MKNKENAGKGTFILRCDFYPQVQLLSREQRGDLLTALLRIHPEKICHPWMA